jgi:hypothetical protein
MYNVKSSKHGFIVRDDEATPLEFPNYRAAQAEIDRQCQKWGMDPKEFTIVPAAKNQATPAASNESFAEANPNG